MKGIIPYILIFFVCAGIVVACIKDDVSMYGPEYDICFDVAIESATKADGKNDYPEDMPFKLWSYRCSDRQKEADGYVIEGEDVYCRGGIWRTDMRHSWPDSSLLAFCAFAPADAEASFSRDGGVKYYGFDSMKDEPLFCALLTEGYEKPDTGEPVSLLFSSPLCRLEFRAFSSAADDARIWLTGIKLVGLNTKGDFSSSPEFCWSGMNEAEDVVFFEGKKELTEEVVVIGNTLDIIPQDIRIKIEYEYTFASGDTVHHGECIVSPGGHMRPECGKWRPYVLKISTEFVEILKPKRYEE